MIRHILSVFFFLYLTLAYSQVGIYTGGPNGALWIGNESVSGSGVYTITNNGNVYAGNNFTPDASAKMSVKGKMVIKDGTQGINKYLISNTNGTASWGTFSLGSEISKWKLSSNSFTYTTSYKRLTGTTTLLQNGIAGITNASNGVNVPAGQYLVFFEGDIGGGEVGNIDLRSRTSGATLFSITYMGWTSGTCVHLKLSGNEVLELFYQALNASGISVAPDIPPYSSSFYYTLTFLKLVI